MTAFTSLFRASRGSATVEFALISLFLFGTIMVGLDFGVYVQQNLKLGSAVEQGGIVAYNQSADGGAIDGDAIETYIKSAAGSADVQSVDIQCNGTSTCAGSGGGSQCTCLTASGGFTSAGSCNSACSSGALSGNYMKIVATATYHAIAVPDRWLGGKTMTQSVVVRLQ